MLINAQRERLAGMHEVLMQNTVAKVIGANCSLILDCFLLQTARYALSMALTCCMCIERRSWKVSGLAHQRWCCRLIPLGLRSLFQQQLLLVIWAEMPRWEQQGQRAGLPLRLLPLAKAAASCQNAATKFVRNGVGVLKVVSRVQDFLHSQASELK